jgi:hypothetical protein
MRGAPAFPLLLLWPLLAGAQDAQPSIHAVSYTAVKNGDVERTRLLGWNNEKRTVDESSVKGGVLVGFDCGVSLSFDREVVTALRPVYRTSAGVSYGREYGKFEMAASDKKRRRDGVVRVVKLRARPGHAVGGMKVRSGLGIDGLSLFYHKIEGGALEATPSFKSEWVGNTTGGSESSLTTAGRPVVGVFLCTNDDKTKVCGLGLITCKRDAGSPDVRSGAAAKPAPPLAEKAGEPGKPAPEAPEKPAEKPPVVAAAPAAPPAARYRDDNLLYGFDVPGGWRAFTPRELERANALLKANYDAGFKPKDTAGNYPYVVVRKQIVPLVGLTLGQAEAVVDRDDKAPAEEVRGALPELLGQLGPGSAGLDGERNRLVTRSTVETPASGKVRTVTVYHLGAQSVIAVQCCAKDDSFDQYLPAFAAMNDSFAFDEATRFHPRPEDAAPPANRLWANLMPLLVFAGVCGVVLLPLMVMLGKKKRRADKDEDEERPARKPASGDPRRGGAVQMVTAGLRSSLAHPMGSVGPPPYFVVKSGQRWTRVYVMQEALLIIDIGVGKSVAAGGVGASQGGLIGGAIGSLIDDIITHRNLTKMKEVMDKLDLLDTEDLVEFAKGGGRNYHLPVHELKYARMDAPSWWESIFHSQLQGHLRVRHQRKGEFRFVFERLEDMKSAMQLLPDVLGELLELNIVLDRRTWKYVRK